MPSTRSNQNSSKSTRSSRSAQTTTKTTFKPTKSTKSTKSSTRPKKTATKTHSRPPQEDDEEEEEEETEPTLTNSNAHSRGNNRGTRNSQVNSTTNQPTQTMTETGATSEPPQTKTFCSRFPGLEIETFEDELPNYTLIGLREAIKKQDSRRSKAHQDVKDLVKIVRMQFEKRILMISLMAGVPKVVIWNLVGLGSKKVKANPYVRYLSFCVDCLGEALPEREDKGGWSARNKEKSDRWKLLSDDQREIFKDPLFFALANLPDYSTSDLDNVASVLQEDEENDGVITTHSDIVIPAPKVHKLSDSDKLKYQPLFDSLVDIDKLHLSHGKPESTASVASLQKRSLLAVRKAHQDFSVVCQQNQIAYYLTTASCGGVNGWSQTFSNNVLFAKWALETAKVPVKFSTYVHGQDAAKEIDGKVSQPSDERKSRLGALLNKLAGKSDAHVPGSKFPKTENPIGVIAARGWPIKIVQKPGSKLKESNLFTGHRKATDAVVKIWLKDIEDGNFTIERTCDQETNNHNQLDDNQPNTFPNENDEDADNRLQGRSNDDDQQIDHNLTRHDEDDLDEDDDGHPHPNCGRKALKHPRTQWDDNNRTQSDDEDLGATTDISEYRCRLLDLAQARKTKRSRTSNQ
ncbi:hypothetical protein DFH28DRAFT_894025 [Melampsora americana]|nr:hypothetical protein DFH28DRAFT_894025 [Melampsora americana]